MSSISPLLTSASVGSCSSGKVCSEPRQALLPSQEMNGMLRFYLQTQRRNRHQPAFAYLLLDDKDCSMAIMEAYFDESGTHAGSPFLCVAGYLFKKGNAHALDIAWREMLQEKSLPFFRMSDCAHGTGPFQGWSKIDTTDLEIRAINLVKAYAAYGFAASVVMDDFHLIPNLGLFDTAYSFACLQMFLGVKYWADNNDFHGDVNYVFESGAQHQSEANAFMQNVFEHPQMRLDFRYSSHTFADKANVSQLQCADLLAWHWFTHNQRGRRGEVAKRKDFRSLLEKRIKANHFDKEGIDKWLAHRSPAGYPSNRPQHG
jgi:Protein of unknown function (DUF3800)